MFRFCRDPHQFTETFIINVDENTSVIHVTSDRRLLNTTAVSDFKKALRKKQTMRPNKPKRYPLYCAVNRSQK